MKYQIRNAVLADLESIEAIYAYARSFMAQTGNPNQWGKTTPPHGQLLLDIENRDLFVLEDPSGIHGVFFFKIGEDPTYGVIADGNWHGDGLYGTIHRIAADGSGGILAAAVAYASSKIGYLRIDTHRDNKVMQRALSKQGFQRCDIIHIADGSERIAYDKFCS